MKKHMIKFAAAAATGFCISTIAQAKVLTVTNTADGQSQVQFELEGELYSGVLAEARAGQATKLNLQYPKGLVSAILLPTSEGDKTVLCSGSDVASDNCSAASLMKKWHSFELGDDPATLESIRTIDRLPTMSVVLKMEMKLPEFTDARYLECEFLDANLAGDIQILEQAVPEAIEAQTQFPNDRGDAQFVFLIKSGNTTVKEKNERARLQLFPVGVEGVKYGPGESFEMEQISESEMNTTGSKKFVEKSERFVFRTVLSDSKYLSMLANPVAEVVCLEPR